MTRSILLAIVVVLVSSVATYAVDVFVDNQTGSKIRLKMIANHKDANAHIDVDANSQNKTSISPPKNSDQVFIVWSGGKLVGTKQVEWRSIQNAKGIQVSIIGLGQDDVLVDFAY